MTTRLVARPIVRGAGIARQVVRGQTLGPEMVLNGDFATDTVWGKGAGWTIGSGVATKVAGSATLLAQTLALVGGAVYELTFTVVRVAGTVTPILGSGGTNSPGTARSASGTFTERITANPGNVQLLFNANATFDGTIDNVSFKQVT